MRQVNLPSGAILTVKPAPFAVARALFQAVARDMKALPITAEMDVPEMVKDIFCIGVASQHIEECLWPCLQRCTYRGPKNGDADLKIDGDTFEPLERRQDYVKVCIEVAKDNLDPFAKSLFAEFGLGRSIITNIRKSKQATTN